eukprot:939004-Amphidinium_carterae.1
MVLPAPAPATLKEVELLAYKEVALSESDIPVGMLAWEYCLGWGLSALHGDIHRTGWEPVAAESGGEQRYQRITKELLDKVKWFVGQPGLGSDLLDWSQVMRMKGLDNHGNLVTKPHKLTLAQVLPSLPPEGLGGAVDAVKFATGHICEVLLNPQLVIADRESWDDVKVAKVHAAREEWQAIGEELVRRGIL